MKTNHPLLALLALMFVLLAACSPAAQTAVTPAVTSLPQATADTALDVEPTAEPPAPTTTETAEEADTSNETTGFPTGKFVSVKDSALAHQFSDDGTFAFLVGEIPVVQGTYQIQDDLYIELTNDESDPACQDHPSYIWSFDGETLSFSPVGEDTCRGRREAFADIYKRVAMPEIKIDAADFAYRAPDTLEAGWVRIVLTNSGAEPHHVQFLRLNDGVTIQQLEEAFKQGEGPALALTQQVGGVGAVALTGSAEAILNLPAGNYVILCFIPSPSDGTPHHAKGMLKSMTVQQARSATATEPSADLIVRLEDYTFDMPKSLPVGPTTIQVVNDGPEPHEFNILRLADGKTVEDVVQFFAAPNGPPPFTPVGGMNGLDAGLSGYVEFEFQPGTYVAICNIPSPKAEGHPHSSLGMIQEFSVAASQ